MDVSATLDGLRERSNGCFAAALIDLETNMVLTTQSDEAIPQETWEEMAKTALDLLTGPTSNAVANELSGESHLQSVVLEFEEQVQLLIRSHATPPLGMLFICGSDVSLDRLLQSSAMELEKIAAAE